MVSPPEQGSGGLPRVSPGGRSGYFFAMQADVALLTAFGSGVPDATLALVQIGPREEIHGTERTTCRFDPNGTLAQEQVTDCPTVVHVAPLVVIDTFVPLNRLDVALSDTN